MPTIRRLLLLLLCATPAPLLAAPSAAATGCDRWAAPGGSDAADGSVGAPFQSVQRLVNSLAGGQIGCLEGGTYRGAVRFNHGGSAGAPLELTAAPGQQATVFGRVYLPKGSDWITVSHLRLDGSNGDDLPSPTVDSAHDQFIANDVTDDHTAICFELGSDDAYGIAKYVLLQSNRIHDCGVLPPTNHEHGIYVDAAVGVRIVNNWIYNNADRGIQLYPNAQNTTITGNVIDHNGEGIIISGADGMVSSNTLISGNVITNSTVRADVESFWPSGNKGTGNVVVDNCVYGGKTTIDRSEGGFEAHDNLNAPPQYVDSGSGNYMLSSGSACSGVLNKAAAFETRAEQRRAERLRWPRLFASLHAHVYSTAKGKVVVLTGRLRDRHVRARRARITIGARLDGHWQRLDAVIRRRGIHFSLRHHVNWGTGPVRLRVRARIRGRTRTALLTVDA